MYRLKEGTFSPRLGIDSPFQMFFSVGNKRNGTMDCWLLPGANSNLIRKGSGSREGATCKGVVKFYDPCERFTC